MPAPIEPPDRPFEAMLRIPSQLRLFATVLLLAILLAAAATAQVQPASVFGDHMVLQRDKPIAVWGTAAAKEEVRVTLDEKSVTTTANEQGRWLVHLEAHAAGGPFTLRCAGSNEVVLHDVLVGEVWICSGQSNMNWSMERSDDTLDVLPEATDRQLRILRLPNKAHAKPQLATTAEWQLATESTLSSFSAVGYGFGRHLREHHDVPVGLVQTAWGGTRAEAWMREDALRQHEVTRPILARWQATAKRYPKAKQRFDQALKQWQVEAKAAKAEGKKAPRRPRAPAGPNDRHAPGRLFHGMVQPLLPMSIRGVIWYQGEANAGRAYQYRTLFPAMIRDWRDAFGQGHFPFLFVQLASFESRGSHPHTWPELREAQTMALSEPNTGMACTIDLGVKNNIHPPHKLEVGRRLALLARAGTYGEAIVPSGPMYSHYTIERSQVRLFFDHVGAGLVAKGGELVGFEVATEDGAFQKATARIDGNQVLVQHADIAAPRYVRYAWSNWPSYSLFNQDSLPASSFRTDSRKGVTAEAR